MAFAEAAEYMSIQNAGYYFEEGMAAAAVEYQLAVLGLPSQEFRRVLGGILLRHTSCCRMYMTHYQLKA